MVSPSEESESLEPIVWQDIRAGLRSRLPSVILVSLIVRSAFELLLLLLLSCLVVLELFRTLHVQ